MSCCCEIKVSTNSWFQEKVRTTGQIPNFLAYLWGFHWTAGNPAGISVLDMGSIYSIGKGCVLWMPPGTKLKYLPCYCQSYPCLRRHRHAIIYLLDLCVKILPWIYVFGKKLLVHILSAGIWAGCSIATKTGVPKDWQLSAQPVCAYRKGRWGGFIIV